MGNYLVHYSITFLWTQLFPIIIYLITSYKNVGKFEIKRNLKAGIRVVILVTIVYSLSLYLFISLSFITQKITKTIFYGLIIFNFIINAIDLFSYINFGTQINSDIFFTILETNLKESKEFIKTYFNRKIWIILVYISWIGILLIFKNMNYIFFSSLIILLEIFLSYVFKLEGTDYTRKYILNTLRKDYKKYREESETYKNEVKVLKKFDLRNEMIDFNKEKAIYVLIIGESSSRNHYSVYNYFRNTTPNLKKLKETDDLVVFNDVISPYPMTRESLLKSLTLASDEKKFYEVPNIIDLFTSAGFKTYWISNQESYGISGNAIAGIAANAKFTKYTEIYSASSRKIKKYDENLFPLFDEVLNDSEDKKLVIIHLMGNHLVYKERYPEKFIKYNNKDLNFNKMQMKYYKIINNYDNSILYTDFCINEFIKKLKEKEEKSFMLYFSDHGDEVYDERELLGHAPGLAGKYTAEIPFILWFSDKYKKDKNRMNIIKSSINKKYSTEDLLHTVLELSYIKWKNYDETKSLINNNFKEKIRIHGNKNYDIEIRNDIEEKKQ